ncbi:MAG TPA: glycosyltransferase family 2 protein [Pyrinomonadaceae bacterium]|nr:glycosyltransferase family 2 protein [Pyrinomonadaceae bacterium]
MLRHRFDDAGERALEKCRETTSSVDAQTISVIIPVYNGDVAFRRCPVSLAAAASPSGEVIVVADGDRDGSRLLAESFGAQVLKLDATIGPARSRKLGARTAQGDIVFFLDADVAISPNTLARLRMRSGRSLTWRPVLDRMTTSRPWKICVS